MGMGAAEYLEALEDDMETFSKIPYWWSAFIASIEDNRHPVTNEVLDDPIIRYDTVANASVCIVCNGALWHGAYDALIEWEHFRDNHEDMVVLVRLRNE